MQWAVFGFPLNLLNSSIRQSSSEWWGVGNLVAIEAIIEWLIAAVVSNSFLYPRWYRLYRKRTMVFLPGSRTGGTSEMRRSVRRAAPKNGIRVFCFPNSGDESRAAACQSPGQAWPLAVISFFLTLSHLPQFEKEKKPLLKTRPLFTGKSLAQEVLLWVGTCADQYLTTTRWALGQLANSRK